MLAALCPLTIPIPIHPLTGTAKVGNTIEVLSDNNSLGFTKTDALGNWSFTVSNTTALPDGTYAIIAIATDTANLKASLQTTPVTMSSLGRTAQEFSNEFAFAVVKDDGSVITWGIDAAVIAAKSHQICNPASVKFFHK